MSKLSRFGKPVLGFDCVGFGNNLELGCGVHSVFTSRGFGTILLRFNSAGAQSRAASFIFSRAEGFALSASSCST